VGGHRFFQQKEYRMFIDKFLKVCTAQAFTALAVSTDSIDLGNVTPKRQIGTGEPMGWGVSVDVAASATTVLIESISATDAALTAGILVHGTITKPAAEFAAGALHFVPLHQGTPTQRFIGIRVTPAGGAATVTLSASLTTHSLFSLLPVHHASGFTIS
jgi:hypothetical protein